MGKAREAEKFVVRLPDGMREVLARVAKEAHRSMNAEIVHRLERSLTDQAELEHEKALSQILVKRIGELEALLGTSE